MAQEFRYKAFISYSSADRAFAIWLHRALENFVVPKDMAREGDGGKQRGRLTPVFRDRDELSASADLSESIDAALAASGALIVLCSPEAAASKWVNEEIVRFRALGRGDRIYSAIVPRRSSGPVHPEQWFPPALLQGASGISKIPLCADFREEGDGRNDGLLKLAAPLLGVEYSALQRRWQVARTRAMQRWTLGVSATAALFAVISVVALVQFRIAVQERIRAENERDRAERALRSANAAASGLVMEIAGNARREAGVSNSFVVQTLIRAQNVLLAALAASDGQNADIHRSLGVLYDTLSDAQADIGDHVQSLDSAIRALEIFRQLQSDGYKPQQTAFDLLISLRKVAKGETNAGRHNESVKLLEEALLLLNQLRSADRASRELIAQEAMTRTVLGMVLKNSDAPGAQASAFSSFAQADELYESILPQDTIVRTKGQVDDPEVRIGHLQCLYHYGAALAQSGDLETAQFRMEQAAEIYRGLGSGSASTDVETLRMVIEVLHMLSGLYAVSSEPDIQRAEATLSEAIGLQQDLIDRGDDGVKSIAKLVMLYRTNAVYSHRARGDFVAEYQLDRALRLSEDLARRFAADPVAQLARLDVLITAAELSQSGRIYIQRADDLLTSLRSAGLPPSDLEPYQREITKLRNQ